MGRTRAVAEGRRASGAKRSPVTTDIDTGEGMGRGGLPRRDLDQIPRSERAALPRAQLVALEFAASKGSPSTRRGYAADLDDYFAWLHGEGLEAFDASRGDVEAYLRRLEAAGQSDRTRARKLAAVRGFYERAVDEELLAASPARRVSGPRISKEPAGKALSEEELRSLIHQAREAGAGSELLVLLLGICGLRVSEVCKARIEHMSPEPGGGRNLRVVGKGRKERRVPLPPLAASLAASLSAGRASGPILRRRYSDHYRVRMGARRSLPPWTELTQQHAWEQLQELAGRAGLLKESGGRHATVHPHMLRHSYTTIALDRGIPLEQVQDSLGHSNPETTRRYDRRRDADSVSPARRLAEALD